MCCLCPAAVSESLILSVQLFALILGLFWALLGLCSVSGSQAGKL